MHSARFAMIIGAIITVGVLLSGCGSNHAATAAKGTGTTRMAGGPTIKTAHHAQLGTILVTSSGMTLYHMTTETNGKIVCTGHCTALWPPLLVPAGKHPVGSGVSGLGTVRRPDGTAQATDHGMPLYTYTPDKKPGQTRGQGVGGIWFVVKTSTKASSSSSGRSGSGY